MTEYRVEHDTMGEVRVPEDAKWRAQTQRAVENFPISGGGWSGRTSRRSPRSRARPPPSTPGSGCSPEDLADAIVAAADEVAGGAWDDHFPIDVFQTGSGTSSNMNMNEVLATLASERLGRDVHPNDHVNASQSSNDVFPSSIHVAATSAVCHDLMPALEHLATSLHAQGGGVRRGGEGRPHAPHGRHAR